MLIIAKYVVIIMAMHTQLIIAFSLYNIINYDHGHQYPYPTTPLNIYTILQYIPWLEEGSQQFLLPVCPSSKIEHPVEKIKRSYLSV